MATISQALAIALEHHRAGRLQAAEQIYRQILAADPDCPQALHLLGLVAGQVGQHAAAVGYLERAVALRAEDPLFHCNLAVAYGLLRRHAEAAACYRRALQLQPDSADAHYQLGNALREQGQAAEALACYRRAVELKPDFAEAHNNLGTALVGQGRLAEAVACFRRVVQLKPEHAEAHSNLGSALSDLGQDEEAVACCRRAAALRPEMAQVQQSLGNVLKRQGRLAEATACYQRALELQPDVPGTYNNLGNAWKAQGRLAEAIACYQRAVQLEPDSAHAHSNLLLALHCRSGITPGELAEAHAQFEWRHAAPLRADWRPHENTRDPQRPLRLGFVSPDFAHHPVGHFLIPAMEHLDRGQCALICYSDRQRKDEMTARFQATASTWREAVGLSDAELAEQIRGDRIDILFDLAGHTACNRLLMLARKPAPIQITWIGYEGTTGLAAIDYLLADRQVLPAEMEKHCRERVLRMPDAYVCFDPPPAAPPVGPLPAASSGCVTLGSFNNLAKINEEVVAVWAEIMRRTAQSRLMLRYKGLADEAVQRRYRDLFAGRGIDPQRLVLLPFTSHAEYLATYEQVDIALDPFPFSGSATTCDALWMGVPVITWPGETFASRHSLTHLANIGLAELAAADASDYIDRAVVLAGDLPRLAGLRAGLRERMRAAPLCDGRRFAENLAVLLRGVWRQWVAQDAGDGG